MRALGIDVGGTFTDAALVEDGRVRVAKVPTAARQEESVVAAAAALGAAEVDRFTHGTTIATNALLQRRGARTALVTNEGFEHVLHLRRQTRAHLYRPCVEHPPPLVPLERCVGVRGRSGVDGELVPLDLSTLPDLDADAIAVSLLFSFRDPGAGAPRRRRATAPLPVGARRRVPRGRAGVPRVRARLDDGGRRVSRACALRVPRLTRRRMRRRRVVRAARDALVGRARDAGRGSRARGVRAPLGPRSRRRRRRAYRLARRLRERAVVRHGRHVDGRLRDRRRSRTPGERAIRRRPPGAPAHARRAHRRRRRRLRRLARRGRCAACWARERGRGSRTGVLRKGRDAGNRHRREPPARPPTRRRCPAGSSSTPERPSERSPASTPPASSTSSTRRWCALFASCPSSRGSIRATSPSSPSAEQARCTPALSPTSSG